VERNLGTRFCVGKRPRAHALAVALCAASGTAPTWYRGGVMAGTPQGQSSAVWSSAHSRGGRRSEAQLAPDRLIDTALDTFQHALRVRSVRSMLTSTMRLGGIDKSDPLPLHEQVAAEVRRAIAEGEAGPGDRLPLARDLAAVLGVNRNTVLRALHVLRDEGLLEFRRGHGIRVAGTSEKSDLLAQVHELVAAARRSGYRKSELIAMIEAVKG